MPSGLESPATIALVGLRRLDILDSVYSDGTMNSLLIRGLRQGRVHGDRDWRELMTDAIRGAWPAPSASDRTLRAERGLGIGGKPYYFYVLRAEEDFGLVVFVLNENEDANWPSNAKGATHFDSGGLWSRKIATNPELDDAGRRTFFQHHDVPLMNWKTAFKMYIHTHYGTVADYLKGSAPRPESGQQSSGTVLVKGSPNDKRAWTWEVRVPHDLIAGRLDLQETYMTEANHSRYLHWLRRHASLPESESRRIQRWVKRNVVVPMDDESVVQAIEDRMSYGIGDQ